MLFRFTRDEEGTERIHVGEVCVARMTGRGLFNPGRTVPGMRDADILDAIERADDSGFWEHVAADVPFYERNEVTVDVPVPETTATLTLVSDGEDQS